MRRKESPSPSGATRAGRGRSLGTSSKVTLAELAMMVETRVPGMEGFAEETEAHQLEVLRIRQALEDKQRAAKANGSKNRHAPPKKRQKAPKAKRQRPKPIHLSRKAQAAIIAEFILRWSKQSGRPQSEFEAIPWLDWRIRSECDRIVRCLTGRRALSALVMMPRRISKLIHREANRVGGVASVAGARLVACAWATWRLARDTFGGNGSPWAGGKVVEGYARAVWCLLVRSPRGEQLSISTLWGTHCGSNHQLGPMARLARAGVWTRVQPPEDVARYVGPSGWAVGQMWFGRRNCGRHVTDADVAEHGAHLQELLWALGLLEPPS